MDHLITMDDVLGIADNCKKFAEFLKLVGNIDIIVSMFFI